MDRPRAAGDQAFWLKLDRLVAGRRLVIDRPRGSPHPRYPAALYPLDYGYLAETRAGDGQGVDVWLGSLPDRRVTAVAACVDLAKGDVEMKILVACTPDEAGLIVRFHSGGQQSALLVERPDLQSISHV